MPSLVPGHSELVLLSFSIFNAHESGWKIYPKWEEGSPLEIEERKKPVLLQQSGGCIERLRLSSACGISGKFGKFFIFSLLLYLTWFITGSWLTHWTNTIGKHDEAMSILLAGIEANPFRSVSLLLQTSSHFHLCKQLSVHISLCHGPRAQKRRRRHPLHIQ